MRINKMPFLNSPHRINMINQWLMKAGCCRCSPESYPSCTIGDFSSASHWNRCGCCWCIHCICLAELQWRKLPGWDEIILPFRKNGFPTFSTRKIHGDLTCPQLWFFKLVFQGQFSLTQNGCFSARLSSIRKFPHVLFGNQSGNQSIDPRCNETRNICSAVWGRQ